MSLEHYSKLIVWQKAMDLTDEIYSITKLLPKDEAFGLVSQMRRAAVSIPSNIAEGHGRVSVKDFKHFLVISQGSAAELETQLLICVRQKYLTEQQIDRSLGLCSEIGRMLSALISK